MSPVFMERPVLEIRCRQEGSCVVLELEGEVCLATVPVLATSLEGITATEAADVVIDLTGVSLLTAEGIGVLLRTSRTRARNGGSVTVRGATGLVARVLDLTGVAGALGAPAPAVDLRAHAVDLVTIHEAADALGVTARDIQQLIEAGVLDAERRGRATLVRVAAGQPEPSA